jgi:CBS domain-containing protein
MLGGESGVRISISAHRWLRRRIGTFHNGPETRGGLASLKVAEDEMKILEVSSAPVFVAYPEQPLAAAAEEMRTRGVGALVVVDPRASAQRPVGILTDRDIVCGQLAKSADLYCLTVADVMTCDLLTLSCDATLTVAIQELSTRGVRRAPVVDDTGVLIGMITLDDLLPVLAQELHELADIASLQAPSHRHDNKRLFDAEACAKRV